MESIRHSAARRFWPSSVKSITRNVPLVSWLFVPWCRSDGPAEKLDSIANWTDSNSLRPRVLFSLETYNYLRATFSHNGSSITELAYKLPKIPVPKEAAGRCCSHRSKK